MNTQQNKFLKKIGLPKGSLTYTKWHGDDLYTIITDDEEEAKYICNTNKYYKHLCLFPELLCALVEIVYREDVSMEHYFKFKSKCISLIEKCCGFTWKKIEKAWQQSFEEEE